MLQIELKLVKSVILLEDFASSLSQGFQAAGRLIHPGRGAAEGTKTKFSGGSRHAQLARLPPRTAGEELE